MITRTVNFDNYQGIVSFVNLSVHWKLLMKKRVGASEEDDATIAISDNDGEEETPLSLPPVWLEYTPPAEDTSTPAG
ncbi:hypothetical protein JOQ06_023461 [Pogonophryne albipinna]|uniref:Uncharacterized protein n=1 Tax=Pogonophryne albipinna TaxID=1090488 RepID=A0AAD6FUC2_9TELE|nr:hypothetical protein JOQ06_023461 [Pogonophryne albipinna]